MRPIVSCREQFVIYRCSKPGAGPGRAYTNGSGGRIGLRRFAAQLLLPLIATHASLRLRLNLYCGASGLSVLVEDRGDRPRSFESAALENKKAGPCGAGPFYLVAGARLSNYMQIEIEPFPLVA